MFLPQRASFFAIFRWTFHCFLHITAPRGQKRKLSTDTHFHNVNPHYVAICSNHGDLFYNIYLHLQYLGHLIIHNSSQLQLIEGKIEGRISRGRPRKTRTTDITTTKGMKRAADYRIRWHGLVVDLPQETTLR